MPGWSAFHFFTPLPPLATEVANHSALVLPALARRAETVVWTDQSRWNPVDGCTVRQFDAAGLPLASLADKIVFYNIGNNPPFHGAIWEASRRLPGIVILHDTWLQNLFAGLGHSQASAAGYVALMRQYYGREGAEDAMALYRGDADIDDLMRRYPLTQAAIEGSRGVVVHNPAELPRLRRLTRAPVWFVPLAGPDIQKPPQRHPRGDNNKEFLQLIIFGHIGLNRRVSEIIEVLARSSARNRYRLSVFGAVSTPEPIQAAIVRHGMEDQVTLHGFVPAEVLEQALADADLALNLRNPTVGEASASQLRIWAHGLPSLVSDDGWYGTLPADCVDFVRPGHEAADLDRHLVAFATDPAPYRRRGMAGHQHAASVHRAETYAALLADIAAELALSKPIVPAPRQMSAAEPDCPIQGNADLASDRWLVGWARVRCDDTQRVTIRVLAGGRLVAETVANEFREDVKRAGCGSGYCGFVLRVPPAARQADGGRMTVVAEWDGAQSVLFCGEAAITDAEPSTDPLVALVYVDVTDLLVFATQSSTVSGIQRVQLGYIAHWLRRPERAARVRCVVFSAEQEQFNAIDTSAVLWLIDELSLSGGPFEDRRVALKRILAEAKRSTPLTPRDGDVFVVTGSFWSFPGFHAELRRLQATTGLRYVQIFYDAVPHAVPETCTFDSVVAYNRAIPHMLDQADAVLSISQFSAGELRWLATNLGLRCPVIAQAPMGSEAGYGEEDCDARCLPPGLGDFVLCVGTIEPRKNHLYLFHLWRRLLARVGRRTPRLVCAGRLGWLTDDLQRHLQATGNLDGHFVILPAVSDAQLRALYRACRFTIYPSVYEGWGLPVSESLAAGRLCVTSRLTSTPEAGGDWAVYLDPFDVGDGFAVVSELLDHPDLVAAREEEIAASYRPVRWAEAADRVWDGIEYALETAGVMQRRLFTPPVLSMLEDHKMQPAEPATSPLAIARQEVAAMEFAQILFGRDWHQIEPWGAWAHGPVARLTFQTETLDDEAVVGYARVGLPDSMGPAQCSVLVNGETVCICSVRGGLQTVRVPLGRGGRIRLDLVLDREAAAPGDNRRLGIGFHRLFVCRLSDTAARLAFLETTG